MEGVPADGTYVTPAQAARMLGVSSKTVARWAAAGRIRCAVTLGGHRRFRVEDIVAIAGSMELELGEDRDEGG